ncbi:MAG TPA: papain-like cysteine protease family protein [Pyrinomonadaceae bacterium]|nr:papain-like cysteine protease family protein [Pyrinomonadaceae bacterium]
MRCMQRLICASILLFVFTPASLADIVQVAPNSYIAGVNTVEFQYFVAPEWAGRQRQQNWCWAACVQMVLNYHGLYVTQEQVVQRVFGQQIDQAADEAGILTALTGWLPDNRGRFSAITASPYVWDEALVNDLAYKWPLIAGLRNEDGLSGHAYVLTALQFHKETYVSGYNRVLVGGRWYNVPTYAQRLVFDYVVLRDPWPTNESKQVWTWAKFRSQLMNLNRVFVVRL